MTDACCIKDETPLGHYSPLARAPWGGRYPRPRGIVGYRAWVSDCGAHQRRMTALKPEASGTMSVCNITSLNGPRAVSRGLLAVRGRSDVHLHHFPNAPPPSYTQRRAGFDATLPCTLGHRAALPALAAACRCANKRKQRGVSPADHERTCCSGCGPVSCSPAREPPACAASRVREGATRGSTESPAAAPPAHLGRNVRIVCCSQTDERCHSTLEEGDERRCKVSAAS